MRIQLRNDALRNDLALPALLRAKHVHRLGPRHVQDGIHGRGERIPQSHERQRGVQLFRQAFADGIRLHQ